MLSQRSIQRLAGIILQGSNSGCRDGQGPLRTCLAFCDGQVVDDVQQVRLAAFIGGAIPFDEPATLGKLVSQPPVFTASVDHSPPPTLNERLFSAKSAAEGTQTTHCSHGA